MTRSSNRGFDFDFADDKTNRFVPFILSFLMYSVAIATMSCFFTYDLTSEWRRALSGHITLEFQSNIDGADEEFTRNQIDEIIRLVQSTQGIKSVKKLQESDILKVIEPWLNGTSIPDDFPFPIIFDVESDEDVRIDLLSLTEKLSKISPGVKIHDHANWYIPIMKMSNCLFFFAVLLSIFIFATMCATVIFITKKTLVAHENIVKILQLIGADNSYISSQFNKYYFGISCRASLISMIVGISTVLGLNNMISPVIALNAVAMGCIAIAVIVPLLTVAMIMVTARKSVMFFLHNDGWID
ncbi:MAG: hypothetical protein LBJ16_04215 [Holosporaceae bacterium]|jgi:cell division transport system permease protein|nr:hypothetical protein [Holosporaceae bacterium]